VVLGGGLLLLAPLVPTADGPAALLVGLLILGLLAARLRSPAPSEVEPASASSSSFSGSPPAPPSPRSP
jgi:hypothetical protein